MANYSATFSGDLTTYIAGKIFDAANMAKEERERAIEEAKKYDVDPKLRRGEFFGRALQSQFGGDLYNRTLGIFDPRKSKPETDRKSSRENRYSAQFKYPDRFARGQSVVDPLIGTPAHVRNLPEYQQLASKEEKKYKSQNKTLGQTTDPDSMFNRDKPVKVRDQKLGTFLAAVVESINSSIHDINKKLDETESGVIEAKEGIAGTIKQLEYNADSLEEKLDAIIAVLREQIRTARKQSDTAEIRDKANEIKQATDLSGTERVVKPDEDPNKVRQLNLLEDSQDAGGQLSLPIDDNQDGFERGGIATGPDSGYYAKLHGNEQIIPLDNNYTQGEPSAVDGKVRPKPEVAMLPKYEMGTSPEKGNIKTMDDMFNKVIPVVMNDKDRKEVKDESENLYAGMELIPKATGIVTLGLLQNALGMMGPLAGPVAPLIKTLSSPIASSFGVPDTVTDKVVRQQETETAEKTRRKVTQSTPAMSTPTSGSQSPSGSGFQWWNPFSWFRGNNNNGNNGRNGGSGGGILNSVQRVSNFMSNPVQSIMSRKPKGLSIKGVQSGFTGMAKEGFDAIMGGDKFRLGRFKPQILGRGAYSAPTLKGAMRYAGSQGSLGGKQTPGGVIKTIVPGSAPRINFLEPQARVAPATFDKGKVLADKLLSGAYSNSPLANKLRNQLISGTAKTALGGAKLGGRLLGILGPILDLAFPEPTAQYDQLTGPNAYYNAPGYRGPKPFNPSQTPSNSRVKSNSIDMKSREFALSRLNRSSNNLDPIVINNMQQASAQKEESVPIRAIATVGNHGLNQYYPSPY